MRQSATGLAVVLGLAAVVLVVMHRSGLPESDKPRRPGTAGISIGDWPASVGTFYGFRWDKGDYPMLAEFMETLNVVHADPDPHWPGAAPGLDPLNNAGEIRTAIPELDCTRKHSALTWSAADGYRCDLRQDLVLDHDDGVRVMLRVVVTPSYELARGIALGHWLYNRAVYDENGEFLEFHSDSDVGFGPNFGLELGDASLIRLTSEDVEEVDGNDSNDVIFVRGNIVVFAELHQDGTPAGFSVAELCLAMDARMLAQYDACSGNHPKPMVGVTLATPTLDFSECETDGIPLQSGIALSLSHPLSDPVSTWTFISIREWDTVEVEGEDVPVPSTVRWVPRTRLGHPDVGGWLDDCHAPTAITTVGLCVDASEHHLVVVAWGPNLIPVIAAATFNLLPGEETPTE